jgi:hypothetical protein
LGGCLVGRSARVVACWSRLYEATLLCLEFCLFVGWPPPPPPPPLLRFPVCGVVCRCSGKCGYVLRVAIQRVHVSTASKAEEPGESEGVCCDGSREEGSRPSSALALSLPSTHTHTHTLGNTPPSSSLIDNISPNPAARCSSAPAVCRHAKSQHTSTIFSFARPSLIFFLL